MSLTGGEKTWWSSLERIFLKLFLDEVLQKKDVGKAVRLGD